MPLTAAGYMSWRARSLSLLSGTAFDLTQEAALFGALCRPEAGQRWLDVGTSAGYYAALLAGAGAHVLACDLSPAMLRVAQRRLRDLFPELGGIDWALLNGEQTGLPRASFDGVTIGATLNETSSPAAMLREAAALLKPGGQLWLMYLGRNGSLGQRALTRLGGLTFLDPAELGTYLPQMERRDLRRVREVVFERWVRQP
ncbi:hypothetical protein GCM10008957_07610 [Deinococcus ruber]|uniref:Methyltransferase type 11 domain-containing protein n=1 Tax=Deinococcus ruber TaxID=1848197 RepID=A0A918BY16_9DEIO|nr:hypothetical protein GCM10008957_07610 [Deinococcus ruber]